VIYFTDTERLVLLLIGIGSCVLCSLSMDQIAGAGGDWFAHPFDLFNMFVRVGTIATAYVAVIAMSAAWTGRA